MIFRILDFYRLSDLGCPDFLGTASRGCCVTPLIVHPTLIVHVNNKRCDCNAYCSRSQRLLFTVHNKRCDCNANCSRVTVSVALATFIVTHEQ